LKKMMIEHPFFYATQLADLLLGAQRLPVPFEIKPSSIKIPSSKQS